MKLTVRPLHPEDFDRCWAIATHRDKFSLAEVNRLREIWAYLLPRDEMRGGMLEQVTNGDETRVAAFGAGIFVTDEWILKLRADPKPYDLTRVLLEARKPGSGVLSHRQIGFYNAQGGLNLVIALSSEIICSAHPEEFPSLAACMVSAFHDVHLGFHLREVLAEVYGPLELQWCLTGGSWRLRDDHAKYYSRSADLFPAEHEHPYLIGATKPEAPVNSPMWLVFQSTPPTLGFSPRQKQVFSAALNGCSTRSIAARLGVSEEFVHKCFQAGYDKMEAHPVFRAELSDERKRQRFLDVLRRHKEEVRPWSTRPVLKRHNGPVFANARTGG